ncbi:DUF7344 domain-containing protein [Natrarchaeobius oligotrophus]|uniref:DUF7344 domain-containing protein n=1 Tax=Natrarchaeobius chitinivorans TaxID=1679083 RepID=A0A3N6MN10_NATCH|nr:hypothetical protein [Natrarchaeobius chitinivorans]RQG98850.1 hypothetical protein EA472_16685 [Natrarchaeobius chitinivorans]
MVDRHRDGGDERETPVRRWELADSEFEPGLDETLLLLSHHRRRDVLYYLSEHELAGVETLATEIVANERGCPPRDVTPADREPITIDLYQNHLPKLTDGRLVEFDRRSGAVRWSFPSSNATTLLEFFYDFEHDDLTDENE